MGTLQKILSFFVRPAVGPCAAPQKTSLEKTNWEADWETAKRGQRKWRIFAEQRARVLLETLQPQHEAGQSCLPCSKRSKKCRAIRGWHCLGVGQHQQWRHTHPLSASLNRFNASLFEEDKNLRKLPRHHTHIKHKGFWKFRGRCETQWICPKTPWHIIRDLATKQTPGRFPCSSNLGDPQACPQVWTSPWVSSSPSVEAIDHPRCGTKPTFWWVSRRSLQRSAALNVSKPPVTRSGVENKVWIGCSCENGLGFVNQRKIQQTRKIDPSTWLRPRKIFQEGGKQVYGSTRHHLVKQKMHSYCGSRT